MKKRILSLALALCLSLSLLPAAALAAGVAAVPSPTKLMVDGKSVTADTYLIEQNNYMKLRDLASMVNGTAKNFEVQWDGAKNAINLLSKTAYTPTAGDMTPGDGQGKTAAPSTSKIYVDGVETPLTAYLIGQNNYFKLRDVMATFDVYVGWDQATGTATLDTAKGYEDPNAPAKPVEKPAEKPADQENPATALLEEGDYYLLGSMTKPTGIGYTGMLRVGTPAMPNDATAKQFVLTATDKAGWYQIVTKSSNHCLAIKGGEQKAYMEIEYQQTGHGGTHILFTFEPAENENQYYLKTYGGLYVGGVSMMLLEKDKKDAVPYYVVKDLPGTAAEKPAEKPADPGTDTGTPSEVKTDTPFIFKTDDTTFTDTALGAAEVKDGGVVAIGKAKTAFVIKNSTQQGFYTISTTDGGSELFLTIDGEQKNWAELKLAPAAGDATQLFAITKHPRMEGAYMLKTTEKFCISMISALDNNEMAAQFIYLIPAK